MCKVTVQCELRYITITMSLSLFGIDFTPISISRSLIPDSIVEYEHRVHHIEDLDFSRVAEVVRGHGGPQPKSLDSDKNFKTNHTVFFRELRFVAIYALFGDLLAKKGHFWVKNSISWASSALLHPTPRIALSVGPFVRNEICSYFQ